MKKTTFLLVTIALLTTAIGQITKQSTVQGQSKYLTTFLSQFSTYKMNIEAAGIATIPAATLTAENVLDIHYAYSSGDENRKGQMLLNFNEKTNRFEGSWETRADNGNVYSGEMYFVFKPSGEADGYYDYGMSAYKITIFDPK